MNQSLFIELLSVLIISIAAVPLFLYYSKKSYLMDHPNERSSHSIPTLRGAGLIIYVSITVGTLFHITENWVLWIAITIGAVVGFLDDRYSLPVRYRASLYGLALILLSYFIFDFYNLDFTWYLPLIVIVGLGAVNAYNFMDGINGISILYTLLLLSSTYILDYRSGLEVNHPLLYSSAIGCAVVGFINIRTRALAFLGDVGSVLLGLVAIFFVASLMAHAESILPLALLMIYGVDTILTIVERLFLRENIFEAHRRHLYQLMSNEMGMPHLVVSGLYFFLQAAINAIVIISLGRNWNENMVFIFIALGTGSLYLLVKFALIKPKIKNKTI